MQKGVPVHAWARFFLYCEMVRSRFWWVRCSGPCFGRFWTTDYDDDNNDDLILLNTSYFDVDNGGDGSLVTW